MSHRRRSTGYGSRLLRGTREALSRTLPRLVRLRLLAGILLAAALLSPVRAQDASDAPSEKAPAAPAAPVAIAPADVAPRAQEASAQLGTILNSLQPDADIARIESTVDGIEAQIEEMNKDPRLGLLGRQSLRSLEQLRQPWERAGHSLEAAAAAVDPRVAALADWGKQLAEMRATWEATRHAATGDGLAEVVGQRIASMLRQIAEADEALAARNTPVLTLQNRISGLQSGVTARLADIGLAEKEVGTHLFRPDHPPLWSHLLHREQVLGLEDQGLVSARQNGQQLAQFFAEYRPGIVNHVAIYLGLLLIVLFLQRRLRKWSVDTVALRAAAHILSRPFSVALLLSALFTRLLYIGAPLVIFEIQGLLVLIPLLRVLPGLVYHSLQRPLYALVGLFAFEQVVILTADDTLLERDLLFLLTLTALASLGWMLRSGGPVASAREGRGWRRSVAAARITLLPLAGSAIANLFGMVVLAMLLTSATLTSARYAVVIFALTLVLRGLFVVLLQVRTVQMLHMVKEHEADWIRRGNRLLHIVAVTLWGYGTLSVFRVWGPLEQGAAEVLGREWTVGTLEISLGAVIAFGVTLWISVHLSRFVRFLLDEDVLPRLDLPRGVPDTISNVAHYLVLAVGLLIAFAAAGLELSKFALIAGALGVGIGFGLQNLVNNFVSGLILIFERPVQVGDTVEVGTLLGQVRRIGIRASIVRTYDGADVIVPNGNLIAGEVVNWTHSDFLRRIEIKVGVAYGTDPRQVVDLLQSVAVGLPEALKQPEPNVLFLGFGDSSLDFAIRFWTSDFSNWLQIQSRASLAVHDALKQANIEIPFPQRDLHLRSVDPGAGATLAKPGRTVEEA